MVGLYDLTVWFLKTTNRFPRNWRITLGDRIDHLLLDMLLLGQKAQFTQNKYKLLLELSEDLESLRILTRLCVDMGCIEGRQREYVAKQIDEIGRQLGGWIKQQKGAV
jgi:hypothetical protein